MANSNSAIESPLNIAQARLRRLLFDSDEPVVVALYAGWGQGKTFFWKTEFDKKINEITPGYVSVFGATSLAEIRERVVVAATTRLLRESDQTKTIDWLTEHFNRFKLQIFKGGERYLNKKLDLPQGVLTQFIEQSALTAGWVLCIDDIERLSKSVPVETLLGYINELKYERGIKVVLIFNREGLEKQEDAFRKYEEKVIDHQIPFVPNVHDLLDLVFARVVKRKEEPSLLDELARRCDVLNLKNIRLLEKTRIYYQELLAQLPNNIEPEFRHSILYSLLLFVWIRYPAPDQLLAGKFDYLKGYHHVYATLELEQQDEDPEKEKMGKLLNEYGYAHTDELDLLLMDYILTDILDGQSLRNIYDEYKEHTEKEKLLLAFRRVWQTHYHSTFKDNEGEFSDALVTATEMSMPFLGIKDLDGALNILSKLDREDNAKALMKIFCDKRGEDLAKTFNRRDLLSSISYTPLDEYLKGIESAAEEDLRTVSEVLETILDEKIPGMQDLKRLAAFQAEEFVDYFTSVDQEQLTSQLNILANMGQSVVNPSQEMLSVQEKAREAVHHLADQSRMNRLRLEGLHLIEPQKQAD